jgi:5-methylcytosine-specific restriction endonuclease McrA
MYCGRNMKDRFDDWMSLEIDHIIPLSKGGDDSKENRITSCNVCNRIKRNYLPEDYDKISRDKLIEKISSYLMKRREIWKNRYKQAMIEYGKSN